MSMRDVPGKHSNFPFLLNEAAAVDTLLSNIDSGTCSYIEGRWPATTNAVAKQQVATLIDYLKGKGFVVANVDAKTTYLESASEKVTVSVNHGWLTGSRFSPGRYPDGEKYHARVCVQGGFYEYE